MNDSRKVSVLQVAVLVLQETVGRRQDHLPPVSLAELVSQYGRSRSVTVEEVRELLYTPLASAFDMSDGGSVS